MIGNNQPLDRSSDQLENEMKNEYDTQMILRNHMTACFNSHISLNRLHQMINRYSRRVNGKGL